MILVVRNSGVLSFDYLKKLQLKEIFMKKFITLLLSLLLLLSIAGCKEPPHVHSYNYKGACSCGESVAMEMTTSTKYWQREASLSPTHSVEAGKTYYYFTQKQ